VSARPGGSLPGGVTGPDSALAQGGAAGSSLACGSLLPNSHADWLGWPGPARLGQPCVSKGLRNFVVCQKLSYIIMQGPGPPDSELLSGAGALALSCRRFLAETLLFGP